MQYSIYLTLQLPYLTQDINLSLALSVSAYLQKESYMHTRTGWERVVRACDANIRANVPQLLAVLTAPCTRLPSRHVLPCTRVQTRTRAVQALFGHHSVAAVLAAAAKTNIQVGHCS